MIFSVIAAVGEGNHVIGTEEGLPWRLPSDLGRFRRLTMGKPVIMGRKTFEHIGRPLPGRFNIVLSRRRDYRPEGVTVARGVREAGDAARGMLAANGGDEAVVIGGADAYAQFFPVADRFYLTVVAGRHEGTTAFPMSLFDPAEWVVRHTEAIPADAKNPHPHTFTIYERVDFNPGRARADHIVVSDRVS